MSSNRSIVVLLAAALSLCGCGTRRVSKEPISYRQRALSSSRANTAKVDVPGGKSVVYRREGAKPQPKPLRPQPKPSNPKATARRQPSATGIAQTAPKSGLERKSPVPNAPAAVPNAPSSRPKDGRAAPKAGDPASDDAKLKALYDSGFLSREEYLRARKGN